MSSLELIVETGVTTMYGKKEMFTGTDAWCKKGTGEEERKSSQSPNLTDMSREAEKNRTFIKCLTTSG